MNRRRLALLLAISPGIGGKSLLRILTRMDLIGMSPAEFIGLAPEALIESFGLRSRQAAALTQTIQEWGDQAEGLEQRLLERNVQLLTPIDATFPSRLETFDSETPAALFCYGNVRLLESATFCVLSSRRTTLRGLETIEKLAEEGVFRSEILVSGHDKPEYQRSAVVPLRWGSPRILCLDRGMFVALGEDLSEEPFRAARLWRFRFDPETDLAVSPFKPDASFRNGHNRIRDALVAGLSARLDFVEVQPGGNMERLARAALRSGRPVRVSDRADIVYQLREAGAEVLAV